MRVAIESNGPRTSRGRVGLRIPGFELAGAADQEKEDDGAVRASIKCWTGGTGWCAPPSQFPRPRPPRRKRSRLPIREWISCAVPGRVLSWLLSPRQISLLDTSYRWGELHDRSC